MGRGGCSLTCSLAIPKARRLCRIGICRTYHRPEECGTRPFFGWSGCRAVTQIRLMSPKMSQGPSTFLEKKRGLRRPSINLASPRRVRFWGSPPRHSRMPVLARRSWTPVSRNLRLTASTDSHRNQGTPKQICVSANTVDRSVSR